MPPPGAGSFCRLWEYAFPEEAKDLALTALKMDSQIHPNTKKMKAGVFALRKALGADPVPSFDNTKKIPMPPSTWCAVTPIGIKKDAMIDDPNGTRHEGI